MYCAIRLYYFTSPCEILFFVLHIIGGYNGSCTHHFFILFFCVFKKSIREHLKTNNITIVILNVKKRKELKMIIILQLSYLIP